MCRIVAITTRHTRAIPPQIHIGDNTHHQDHAITPVSFSVIKSIVSNDTKLGPDDLIIGCSDIMIFP
jgi:hypothetical protein